MQRRYYALSFADSPPLTAGAGTLSHRDEKRQMWVRNASTWHLLGSGRKTAEYHQITIWTALCILPRRHPSAREVVTHALRVQQNTWVK